MVIARHHVLCAKIEERDRLRPRGLLNVAFVAGCYAMRESIISNPEESDQDQDQADAGIKTMFCRIGLQKLKHVSFLH